MDCVDRNDNSILVIDGGTGREIERRGGPFRQPEWSALALYEDSAIVQEVHESFVSAGACAITTNTYAVVPFHIGKERYQRDSQRLLKLAVDLAIQARSKFDKKILVLGSIPPSCGSYEPGSFNETESEPILNDFLDAFDSRVDVLLLETIGSIQEAEFYVKAIEKRGMNLPIWLSFCIKADHVGALEQHPRLLTDDTLKEAVDYFDQQGLLRNVKAILVNCCDVRFVSESVQELRASLESNNRLDIRIGAYPNAFSIPPPDAANHTLRQVDFNITPEYMKERGEEWIKFGATLLGGCCGVGPDHIEAMASLVQEGRK